LAAAIGSGVISDGILCIIAGTWSINQVITSDPIVDKRVFLCSLYAVPGMWLTLEASPASATNLEWFVNNFCFEEKQQAQARGISVYDVCNEKVASLAPGSTDIIFHPYLFGSDVQATARAGFYGLGAWHTKTHMLRALYEGVVYGHMNHIEKLRAAGAVIEKARMTGGGSHSHVWTQMFSDALDLPIEVPEGAEVARAAWLPGIGAGGYCDHADAVARWCRSGCLPDNQATPHSSALRASGHPGSHAGALEPAGEALRVTTELESCNTCATSSILSSTWTAFSTGGAIRCPGCLSSSSFCASKASGSGWRPTTRASRPSSTLRR
jgi:sugar (pentulose or hexulose) kinase